MGYVSPVNSIQLFQYDTTNLIVSSDSETSTSSDEHVTAKELTLQLKVYNYSDFYVTFDLRNDTAAKEAKAKVWHNGVQVGETKSQVGDAWDTKNVDMSGETWQIGDTLSVSIKAVANTAEIAVGGVKLPAAAMSDRAETTTIVSLSSMASANGPPKMIAAP